MRIRLGRWDAEFHRRALHITREPNPQCPTCHGSGGGWVGTSHGPDWNNCHCIDQLRTWRIPLWRRTTADLTQEAPF